ncbi:hypothetical protein GGD81_000126 [Rhodobium orientis]|nr:hypothetical protein [Rhodobium orientis]MBB4301111.1 hypothetical protein [Rhodobium orientis]
MALNILVARSYFGQRKINLHNTAVAWCKLTSAYKRIRRTFAWRLPISDA